MVLLVITDHMNRVWLENDWRSYYLRLKRPRVSWDNHTPGRYVRKPRFLQAPYGITICLFACGAASHWLTSESFFVVEISATLNREIEPASKAQRALIFYLTHSPAPMALGALLVAVGMCCFTVHLLVPRRTAMPMMNGSVRVVLASCTRLTGFPAGGIAWGEISENNEERVAGFGALVRPLSYGENYGGQQSELSELEPED